MMAMAWYLPSGETSQLLPLKANSMVLLFWCIASVLVMIWVVEDLVMKGELSKSKVNNLEEKSKDNNPKEMQLLDLSVKTIRKAKKEPGKEKE